MRALSDTVELARIFGAAGEPVAGVGEFPVPQDRFPGRQSRRPPRGILAPEAPPPPLVRSGGSSCDPPPSGARSRAGCAPCAAEFPR